MSCAAFEQLIALYVEGDLWGSELLRVETHLKRCAVCRGLMVELRGSQAVFKSLRQGDIQTTAFAEVRQRVLDEVGGMEPAPGWVLMMHRLVFAGLRRRNAIAGFVLAALVSGGLWYGQQRDVIEPKREAPVEVVGIEAPVSVGLSEVVHQPAEVLRIGKRPHPQEVLELLPVDASDLQWIDESASLESRVSQIPMKFVTDDPDIIIYWLPSDKGD